MPERGVDAGGIKGESFREVWAPPVEVAEQRRFHEEFMQEIPASARKNMPTPEFHAPWISIGVAPTEHDVERELHRGSA